jgi:hypothetical protein
MSGNNVNKKEKRKKKKEKRKVSELLFFHAIFSF